jgi:hypothetical protein
LQAHSFVIADNQLLDYSTVRGEQDGKIVEQYMSVLVAENALLLRREIFVNCQRAVLCALALE